MKNRTTGTGFDHYFEGTKPQQTVGEIKGKVSLLPVHVPPKSIVEVATKECEDGFRYVWVMNTPEHTYPEHDYVKVLSTQLRQLGLLN